MLFQTAQPVPSYSPCFKCQGITFWENLQGQPFCLVCFPPPAEWVIRRRLELQDGRMVDTTERDFRLRYPAETWDYREHINSDDANHLAQRLDQMPCPWCGRRGGAHSTPCGTLHDAWEARIEFGKHKGKKVKDLPPDYLRFLLGWDKLHEDLRREICRILAIPYKEPVHEA